MNNFSYFSEKKNYKPMQELPPRTPIPFKRLSDNTCGEVTVPSNSKWCFLYNCTVASEPFFFSIFTKEPQAATKTDKTNKQKKEICKCVFPANPPSSDETHTEQKKKRTETL